MKQMQNKQRSRLMVCKLKSLVILEASELQADIDKLAGMKHKQKTG
jgi:hypothetical protein